MDIANLRTFLELAATGNFSRVAERLHITQSTVSARIKVLEDYLNCPLFERSRSGVVLTSAGRRFHQYAASMQQLWQQGQQEVALPSGFEGALGLGIHMALWQRFLPEWMSWMRGRFPLLGLHIETDYSERLTELVTQGLLDLAVTYMPKVPPGLHVEEFVADPLVMVSRDPISLTECQNTNYLYIDWSYGYREQHFAELPHLHNASINVGLGEIALRYLLDNPGCAYLPIVDVRKYLDAGQLHLVGDAPELSRPTYLVHVENPGQPDRLQAAITGLKTVLKSELSLPDSK